MYVVVVNMYMSHALYTHTYTLCMCMCMCMWVCMYSDGGRRVWARTVGPYG